MEWLQAIAALIAAVQAREAHEERKEAREAQQASAERKNIRSRRRVLEQRRIKAAQIRASAAGGGVAQSSAVAGGIGSLTTQAAGAVGESQTQSAFDASVNRSLGRAARHEQQSQTTLTIGNVGQDIIDA